MDVVSALYQSSPVGFDCQVFNPIASGAFKMGDDPTVKPPRSIHTKVRARAPLRLGLAGGGTDLSPYCDLHGGAVLNVTINRFAHATLTFGGGEVVFAAADLEIEEKLSGGSHLTDGPLALHRAVYERICNDFLNGTRPVVRLTTSIDAPRGSGLGASSALVVAMVDAFRVAFDLPLGRYDVARVAYEIERHDVGLAGGRQDHYSAAFGGLNFIEFLADDRVVVNPLRLQASILNELQASLLVCYTGQSRTSHTIIAHQVLNLVRQDEATLAGMHQLKSDAFDMKMALFRSDFDAFGKLLSRSWVAKKATSSNITNDRIEELWRVATDAGALSGKVSGAGGGGFLMFVCDPEKRSAVLRSLKGAGGEPETVAFSSEGVEGWGVR